MADSTPTSTPPPDPNQAPLAPGVKVIPAGKPDRTSKPGRSWLQMQKKAKRTAAVVVSAAVLISLGLAIGYFTSGLSKKTPAPAAPTVQTLTTDEIKKLGDVGSTIGSSGQILNIGANALFRGKIDVGNDVTVGGRLNSNGTATLGDLNVTGAAAVAGLTVGQNLAVAGSTSFQKGIATPDLAISGGLTVGGTASINSLNVSTLATRSISVAGPLTIGHLVSQGAPPTASGGGALGAGGTLSLSGNDTAGVVNLNVGSGPGAGVLATVVFRGAYGAQVHIMLTPLTGASAALPVYVSRTPTGFQIRCDVPAPVGAVLAYDYIVVQ